MPRTTLGTLVRRGLIELVDEPQAFTTSKLKPRQSPFEFEFSAAQKAALAKIGEAVAARKFGGLLLHGITGSGKTAVYLACMRQVLDAGRSSILLVPEIGLTPAVAADLHQVFGDEVAILHSGLSDAERAEQWHRIRRGEARVVAGTRSAVFAPVSDLALIIVDEEQDSSYKQEETPRYHARDVAVMRAKMAGAAVVLDRRRHRWSRITTPRKISMRWWSCRIGWKCVRCRRLRSSTCGRSFRRPGRSKSSHANWRRKFASGWKRKSRSWCCSTGADTLRWCCAARAARRCSARIAPSR